jgi:two-component system LytT family response regulator
MDTRTMEKRLFVKSGKVYHRIKMDDVLYILTEGNYSTFYTTTSKYTAKISLKQAGDIIPAQAFVRVHRNYIVCFDKIEKIDVQGNKIFMDDMTIPIGKSFKKDLLCKLTVLG